MGEIVAVRADGGVQIRLLGSHGLRWWSAGLAADARPVAPDGLQRTWTHAPPEVERWLQEDPVSLLKALARDELARGEVGIRKRVLRTTLQDMVPPEQLDAIVESLGEQLENTQYFHTKGERAGLVYVLADGPRPAEPSRLRDLACELGLATSRTPNETLSQSISDGVKLWQKGTPGHSDPPGRAADIARLLGERHLLGEDLEATVWAAVTPSPGGTSLGLFSFLSDLLQQQVVERVQAPGILARIVWSRSTHRRARARALTRCRELGQEALKARGALGPEPSLEGIAAAVADLASHEQDMPGLALLQACTMEPPGVDALRGEWSVLAETWERTSSWSLLGWLGQAASLEREPDHILRWAEVLGQLRNEHLAGALRAVAVGGRLLSAGVEPLRSMAGLVKLAGVKHEIQAWSRREREEQSPGELERAAALLKDGAPEELEAALERYAHWWRQLDDPDLALGLVRDLARQRVNLLSRLSEETQRAESTENAERVLGERRRDEVLSLRDRLEEQARQQATETQQERVAGLFSEILTAVQTIASRETTGGPISTALAPLERRLLALMRRWDWQPIGRVGEVVEPDIRLHDIRGTGQGDPVVLQVGVASTDGDTVVLRANVARIHPPRR